MSNLYKAKTDNVNKLKEYLNKIKAQSSPKIDKTKTN